ncbi:Forkhead box protein Q1 [Holothuria leucospilota]|uniref:Forkhead box protein Q1 n=1 Tax=Holothuria leucospilota TaxID=206669 RepID=A0A9Q1BLU1_HOLLE|nr:Forkhead box protein Q1 [Holothuria leucospilota]
MSLENAYETEDASAKPKRRSGNRRPQYQRHLKLPHTYAKLITMAIEESKTRMVTLHDIQDYLQGKYPCFNGSYTGWKNSLRHNLSANPAFVKVLRNGEKPRGKDNYWTLNEDVASENGIIEKEKKPDIKLENTQKPENIVLPRPRDSSKRNLSFSIENLLRPSPKKRKGFHDSSKVLVNSVNNHSKRPCNRILQSTVSFASIWRHQMELRKYENLGSDDRIPVCYSEQSRNEELRIDALSVSTISHPSTFIPCSLEGCELNHDDDFIVCELENCKVCKPRSSRQTGLKNSTVELTRSQPVRDMPVIPCQLDGCELCEYSRKNSSLTVRSFSVSEANIDFSKYEIDQGRLENLRESLEVQACGGVKAALIKEEY